MTLSLFDSRPLQDDAGWTELLRRLPADLDQSAFTELALFRHRRFTTATLVLRLILAYACGLSMPIITAWAAAHRLVTITPEALHYRIKQASHWLGALVVHLLAVRAGVAAVVVAGCRLRLRLIDGTFAPRPGATGADWRVHCSLDLRTLRLDDVQLTPETTGESFTRFTPQEGDVFLGDRNFGTRRGVWHVLRHGADVLVRIILSNFPLQTRESTAFPLWEALRTLAPGASGEWAVQTKPLKGTKQTEAIPAMPGRLVAYRLLPEAALKVREQHRKRRCRSQEGSPGAATVEGWEYVVLFTTLSADLVPTDTILALYRFRWQIELAIKRYKSLCGLAQLQTRNTRCCQTILWAKLLLILLQEDLGSSSEAFPPDLRGCHPSAQSLAVDGAAPSHADGVDHAGTAPDDPARRPAARMGTVLYRYANHPPTPISGSHSIPA